jgi:hypothetical protein
MGAVRAGLAYGAALFGCGFVLGAMREFLLAPLFGRGTVVAVEAPVLLLLSWLIAGWLIRRCAVPGTVEARIVMGLAGFVLLMLGEAGVAVFGFGRPLSMHLAGYATARGLLELAPQIGFGLIPLLRLLREPAS